MTTTRTQRSRVRLSGFETLESRAMLTTLVKYDFTGAAGNQAATTPAYVDTNMTATSVTRGPGLTAQSLANTMNASGWTTSLSLDSNDYFSFGTWAPDPGYAMTLTHLRYAHQSPTVSSPFRYSLRSSLDNFASSITAGTYPTSAIANTSIYLMNLDSAYANLTVPIEFRLYAYDAGSASGQLRLYNHTVADPQFPDSNGLIVDGSVEPLAGAQIVGRHLFYNQSGTAGPLRYDGNDPAINADDDLAIATDKVAYLPGSGAATFANVSSYTKGINGIMVDIAGGPGTVSASDFVFRVGNNNAPSSWATAPTPSSISVRAGAGVSGSDRVTITWANGAIQKEWLEVAVLATANTGLPQKAGYPAGIADMFYFGNAVGDSGLGDSANQANVNTTDELAARNNPASLGSNIPLTNVFDYNRDGQVNVTDALVARNHPTNPGNVTRFLSLANPPGVPEIGPASDPGEAATALSTLPATDPAMFARLPHDLQWVIDTPFASLAPATRSDGEVSGSMARHEAPIAVHPSRIAADCGANWLAETLNRRSGVNAQPRRQVLYAAAVDEIFEALGSALLARESLDALAIAD